MCNACGFVCCAWDGFEGCECDCKNEGCWELCGACRGRIPPGEDCFNACDSDMADDPEDLKEPAEPEE